MHDNTAQTKAWKPPTRLIKLHTNIPDMLTELLKHLVTLVQYKVLHIMKVEGLLSHKGQYTPRGTNHNMRTIALQCLLVLLNTYATKKDGDLDAIKILGEPFILLVYLIRQLPMRGKRK